MRVNIPVLVLSLLGVFRVHDVSATCSTSDVELKYNQLGQSFLVDVDGNDPDDEAPEALKGSPEGAFIFGPDDVDAYNILFTQGVEVDSFKFQIRLSSSVRVRAFQAGISSPGYNLNVTTGGNKWELKHTVFDINLSNVVKITITWVSTGSELGLQKMVINACATAPCVPGQAVYTNVNLDLPAGFTIEIPGPSLTGGGSFSSNPVAVFEGSQSKVRLRNLTSSFNYININSTSAFSVSEIEIETRRGEGVIVEAYSDPAGNDLLFIKGKDTALTGWVPFAVNSVLGQIFNVRRLDIHVLYDISASNQRVNVRNLYINTCQ